MLFVRVITLPVGQLSTNCYLMENDGEIGIVDPGDDGDFIMRKIADLEGKPVWVALTHGHFDHVLAVTELSLAYKIPVYLHPADKFLLKDAKRSAEYFLGVEADPMVIETESLLDGGGLAVGKSKLEVKAAPGHTPGGVCLYSEKEKVLFCGDLMFEGGGVGRTDFKYCSTEDLKKSIKEILKLPEETIVYSGHGEQTNIEELKSQLF